MLTELNRLVIKFDVYTGTGTEQSGKGHRKKVVLHLINEKVNSGHSIYMDNFYNSPNWLKCY